jgi:hypothetical protein
VRTLFSLTSVRGKGIMAGTLTLCIVSIAAASCAQDRYASPASLPNAPSTGQQYVSSPGPMLHSLTFDRRMRIYRDEVFGPETILGPAFGAAIGQWEDEPLGWPEGGDGFGERVGSGIARHTIAETIRFGVAAADGEDSRYLPSEDTGEWARTRHAIVSTFVSRTASGSIIPAYSRFAGIFGAAFISNTWYPSDRATAGYAAERGSTGLAASVGFNVARELVPFFRRGTR